MPKLTEEKLKELIAAKTCYDGTCNDNDHYHCTLENPSSCNCFPAASCSADYYQQVEDIVDMFKEHIPEREEAR